MGYVAATTTDAGTLTAGHVERTATDATIVTFGHVLSATTHAASGDSAVNPVKEPPADARHYAVTLVILAPADTGMDAHGPIVQAPADTGPFANSKIKLAAADASKLTCRKWMVGKWEIRVRSSNVKSAPAHTGIGSSGNILCATTDAGMLVSNHIPVAGNNPPTPLYLCSGPTMRLCDPTRLPSSTRSLGAST